MDDSVSKCGEFINLASAGYIKDMADKVKWICISWSEIVRSVLSDVLQYLQPQLQQHRSGTEKDENENGTPNLWQMKTESAS